MNGYRLFLRVENGDAAGSGDADGGQGRFQDLDQFPDLLVLLNADVVDADDGTHDPSPWGKGAEVAQLFAGSRACGLIPGEHGKGPAVHGILVADDAGDGPAFHVSEVGHGLTGLGGVGMKDDFVIGVDDREHLPGPGADGGKNGYQTVSGLPAGHEARLDHVQIFATDGQSGGGHVAELFFTGLDG